MRAYKSKSLIINFQFVALMQDTFDFQSLVKKYPELPYALLAIFFYCASIFFGINNIGGTFDFYGIVIHTVSTPLWAICGLMSLYFLYTAFFDMWIYAIHLLFAYYLTGAGFLAMYIFYDDVAIRILSIALIVAGLGFVGYFIIRVGNVRSYRIISSSDPESARERFSLHSWYIFPFLFFGIAAISFIDLGYWYQNSDHTPYVHLLSEFSLIIVIVYLLWKPENVLFYGTKESDIPLEESDVSAESRRSAHRRHSPVAGQTEGHSTERGAEEPDETRGALAAMESRIKKRRRVENCPGFDSPPVMVKKSCPGCGEVNEFEWCPQSEEYLIRCPSCDLKTYHGRKVCIHCKARLQETVSCSKCGTSLPVRRFKDIR